MAKILVRRGDAIVEFENEKAWKKEDGDIRLFLQDDFNALDAKLNTQYEAKYSADKTRADRLDGELTTLRQDIQSKQEVHLNGLKEKIAEAKKTLSPKDLATLARFEKIGVQEAYDWLTDESITKEGKKKTPITPAGDEGEGKTTERRRETII